MTNPTDSTQRLSIVDPPFFGIASGHHFDIGPLIETHFRPRKPRGPSKFTKRDLERAVRAARSADETARVVIERATGNIIISFARPDESQSANAEVAAWNAAIVQLKSRKKKQ